MRQKVLSPRQSYPHRSRKRAYRFTILDLPSTLLPIKSMRSSQLLSPPLLFSLLFSAICCSLSQLFSTLLYSANSCLLRIYIYIYSSQLFFAPLISPLPRLLYLFSTLFDSSHIVSPLLNSSCVLLAFLTSSHRCRNSYQLFPISQLFSTRRHFSTLLCSWYFQVSARGLCYNTQMD